MLKKSIVVTGIVLGLLANAAWADERGAAAGAAFKVADRAQACAGAKYNADHAIPFNAIVTGHSSCDCSQDSNGSWTCTVDAQWEKERK